MRTEINLNLCTFSSEMQIDIAMKPKTILMAIFNKICNLSYVILHEFLIFTVFK